MPMTTHLIDLPCTAAELEAALHKICDHDGHWDATVCARPMTAGERPSLEFVACNCTAENTPGNPAGTNEGSKE